MFFSFGVDLPLNFDFVKKFACSCVDCFMFQIWFYCGYNVIYNHLIDLSFLNVN